MVKRIIASFLILIVLVGTVGFSYDAHYCGGDLVEDQYSFLTQDLSCGMAMEQVDSGHDVNVQQLCCSSKHETFQIDDDFVDYDITELILDVDFAFPEAEYPLFTVDSETKYEFIGYSPPPLEADIVVLNQSFII